MDGFAGEAVPKDFAVQYLVGAFMAVLIWWLDRGAKVAPERLDQMFRAMALRTGRVPGKMTLSENRAPLFGIML